MLEAFKTVIGAGIDQTTLKQEAAQWLLANPSDKFSITSGVDGSTSRKDFIQILEQLRKKDSVFYQKNKSQLDDYLSKFEMLVYGDSFDYLNNYSLANKVTSKIDVEQLKQEKKADLKDKASEWLLKNPSNNVKVTKGGVRGSNTQQLITIFERLQRDKVFYKHHQRAIDWYLKNLEELQDNKYYLQFVAPNKIRCSLSLWGHKGTAGGAAEAGVSLGPASAVAKTDVTGQMKHTSYRFQTVCHTKNKSGVNLISTQDTVIDYRQVRLSAEVAATLKTTIPILGKKLGDTIPLSEDHLNRDLAQSGKSIERPIYNMMFYRSAHVYWFPDSLEKTIPGNGLCFGMSVLIARLIRLAQNKGSEPKLMKVICQKLGVNQSDMEAFLDNSLFVDASPEDFSTETVLLESALTPPTNYQIPISTKTSTPSEKLLSDMQTKHGSPSSAFTLQALRTRYRIADIQENTKTFFKLGLAPPIVSLNINLSKVTQVGQEGIVDLYVHWFADNLKQFNQGVNIAQAYEEAIPPVALLHQ
ncbi:MAG: hypothetical protein F6K47_37350 [Symploca sp. SIO2E6]|nr:hypothetical protein [Symploca sp. SIO2E6]